MPGPVTITSLKPNSPNAQRYPSLYGISEGNRDMHMTGTTPGSVRDMFIE